MLPTALPSASAERILGLTGLAPGVYTLTFRDLPARIEALRTLERYNVVMWTGFWVNAVSGVLLLIASFGALSGLYILLDAPFVAVIQIIVYAGAIMVLFLFVVMLLNASRPSVVCTYVDPSDGVETARGTWTPPGPRASPPASRARVVSAR